MYGASLLAQVIKNQPAMQEIWVWSRGRENSLEKEMATHSNILVWEIPWTGETDYSPWGHEDSDMTEQLTLSLSFFHRKKYVSI